MSSITGNSPDNQEKVTFSFEGKNKEDEAIIDAMFTLLKLQKRCDTCENYSVEGALGGYQASYCKKYGCLEYLGNPHFDCDGSKCESYKRKE